jgi:EAL domain-containing protein (putative c-di-GMP-specific phosphodiesterase class I)
MDIFFSKKYYVKDGVDYLLQPRIECISSSIELRNCFYEFLTEVKVLDTVIDPKLFFSKMSEADYYSYLRDVIEEVYLANIFSISININLKMLNSNYLDLLLMEFRGVSLSLEMDETIAISNEVIKRMKLLSKNFNCEIWLDDFGTGSSNFDSINRFRYDAIKLSKDLFWELYSQDLRLLTHLIINLKKKTARVIVEGVDTFEKYVFCKELNTFMQGYFFKEIMSKSVVK